eukprot:243487_1
MFAISYTRARPIMTTFYPNMSSIQIVIQRLQSLSQSQPEALKSLEDQDYASISQKVRPISRSMDSAGHPSIGTTAMYANGSSSTKQMEVDDSMSESSDSEIVPSSSRKPKKFLLDDSDDEHTERILSVADTPKSFKLHSKRKSAIEYGEFEFNDAIDQKHSRTIFTTPAIHKPKLIAPRTAPVFQRSFSFQKETLARNIFRTFNQRIFDSRLPEDLAIVWTVKLNTTAGRCFFRSELENRIARIELSTKVINSAKQLRQTLSHEMCHAAAWVLDSVSNPPHGKHFKFWSQKVGKVFPDISVTTCHDYEINYKFRWKCVKCGKEYGRHSNSIDTLKHRCGLCSSKLASLGRFKRDGTPATVRKPNIFALFVKENFAKIRSRNPNASHQEIMNILSGKYKLLNL